MCPHQSKTPQNPYQITIRQNVSVFYLLVEVEVEDSWLIVVIQRGRQKFKAR